MKKTQPLLIVLTSAALVLTGCQPSVSTPDAPDSASNETTSLFELAIGTCLDDADTPLSADLTEVPTVSCDEPHDSELFAIVTVDDGIYPGVDDLVAVGQTKCQAVFADFVGIDFRSSALDFHFYYPTPSSWAQGDRKIFCLVGDPGLKVQGTLQNARR
jgi:hypothetical protein